MSLIENLQPDELAALREELRRLSKRDDPQPQGRRVTEEEIDCYAACTDQLCEGHRQVVVRARRTFVEETYGFRNATTARGKVGMEDAHYSDIVENTHEYLAFLNEDDVPCPVCDWPRELSRQQRPHYRNLSGADPWRLAREEHIARGMVAPGEETTPAHLLVDAETRVREAGAQQTEPVDLRSEVAAALRDLLKGDGGPQKAARTPANGAEAEEPEEELPRNIEGRDRADGTRTYRGRGRIDGEVRYTPYLPTVEQAVEAWETVRAGESDET